VTSIDHQGNEIKAVRRYNPTPGRRAVYKDEARQVLARCAKREPRHTVGVRRDKHSVENRLEAPQET
jgi:hypothetical protein